MDITQVGKFKEMEEENARLKKLVVDHFHDDAILKEVWHTPLFVLLLVLAQPAEIR